jgi:hypothetical protein
MTRHQGMDSLSLFIVGGLAGAALGLMLAPEDGAGTRGAIGDGARGLGSRFRGLGGLFGWGRPTRPIGLTPPHEHGDLLFSNRPEHAADIADPLLSGETLASTPRPGTRDPIDDTAL